ncbi:MAG: MarR family transcriptional regulator [Clostridia bacterium]|nr:MarR family transcriptional regulator [Clostridia bacterium]
MHDDSEKYEELKLENQLCFPLYAVSNLIIRKYKTYLKELDLTYTQYITMMALWEEDLLIMAELNQKLHLNSSTLSPVLRRLEEKGYIEKGPLEEDERILFINLTDKGYELRDKALKIPKKMAKEFKLEQDEAKELHRILYKILEQEEKSKNK